MRNLMLIMVFMGMLSLVASGETVIVDDHFDDNAIGTNTTGTGTGFNSLGLTNGSVTEADSKANLINTVNGAARALITSKDGAAIGSGITRFEFKGLTFALSVAGTGTGPARTLVAVKHDDEANDPDSQTDAGFYVQFESDSFSTIGNNGAWNGTSALIYVAEDNTRTVLARWELDTLNWDSGTQNFTPVLDVTLDLGPDGYSLFIEGDTITLLSGSLENTYADAGITNELTTGYAYVLNQSEFPLINLSVDQIIVTEDASPLGIGGPHDPAVLPENEDGTSGTLQTNNTDVEVTFTFKAAMDPNDEEQVNPDILGHYIYLQTGAPSDPNLYLFDYVEHSDMDDPNVSYGPMTLDNGQDKTFKWKAEEALDDGTGDPYPAGNPNNIFGSRWSFTTISRKPKILVDPENVLADFSGNASFSAKGSASANYYRWYKVGSPDVEKAEGALDSTKITTWNITGATQADEGQYYCIVYNGDPDAGGIASDPSAAATLWYPRLVNHYTMESMTYVGDPNGITPDAVSGYDLHMASNDTGTDVPVLDPNVPSSALGASSLKFNNPRGTDPSTADAQYAKITQGLASAYMDITISMWVNSSGGSAWNRILDFGNNTDNYMFVCVNTGSVNRQARFAVKVAGTEQTVDSATEALPDNEWTYVTATLTGSTARIYVNGELDGTNTALTNDPISYGPTTQNWLGRSQWGSGDGYFNGMLDELMIYNYARTTEQIAQDYLDVKGDWVCNNELYDLPYDFDGDCQIGLGDLMMLAEEWMDNYRIYSAE